MFSMFDVSYSVSCEYFYDAHIYIHDALVSWGAPSWETELSMS